MNLKELKKDKGQLVVRIRLGITALRHSLLVEKNMINEQTKNKRELAELQKLIKSLGE